MRPADAQARLARWQAGLTDSAAIRAGLRQSLRRLLVVLGITVTVLFAARLVLNPLAAHLTRQALQELDGFSGDFGEVHISISGLGYDITHLRLVKATDAAFGAGLEPLFYARQAHLGIDWRELLHGRLTANLRLDNPKIVLVDSQKPTPIAAGAKPGADLTIQLKKVTGLRIDRIDVVDGELLLRESRAERHPQELRIRRLQLVAQNLVTRPSPERGMPATVTAHGEMGRRGDLTLAVAANPLAVPLTFAGQASLKGVEAAEIFESRDLDGHPQSPRGTVDVFADFVSANGALTLSVKPLLRNVEARNAQGFDWSRLIKWLADKSVDSPHEGPGRDRVGNSIALDGTLTAPDIQPWPTILGVIRNVFVEGAVAGFRGDQPHPAEPIEGVLQQQSNPR